METPRTAADVRRRALGFRQAQVERFVLARREDGAPFPSLGELKRALGFYDKAGALRALQGLRRRGRINDNPPSAKFKA